MKIAVVGGGYAGLALVWHLLQKTCSVTVFEKEPAASYASTGLLHRAPGKKAETNFRAQEGMQASLDLLTKTSVERPVFEQSGILRFAADQAQRDLFQGETLWIPDGIAVYSRLYLRQLKKICAKAHFIEKRINDLEELKEFDRIVLAAGAETLRFAKLPLKTNIGQALLCRCPEPLSMSYLCSGHITPSEDPSLCWVGSTYEHTEKPDPQKAKQLLEKVSLFYPRAKEFQIVEVCSGVRIAPLQGYQPLVQQLDPKTWVLSGFGSRGLLYHALLAKELAEKLV